ncbi:MAG: MFS transporter [Patescibacteria group bacterium]
MVTAGTVCSALSSPGQSFLLSLYVEPLIADTGVSRVGLATLYGACTLAAAACLPLAGRIADRVTGRRYMTWVLLCMALALALLASARGAAALAIAFFMLRLFGQGAIGLGTLTATVRWFRRRRARALSVVGLGYAAGEMLFPAVVLLLTALVGWRGSLWLLAVLYAAVFAPGIALLLRERDTAADDEYYREMVPPEITLGVIASHANRPFTVREATRTRTFWLALTIVV